MADTKISALPASTTPLAGTEVLPIVQSSATKQVSVANLTAGRAISATQITLSTGNLVVASGQGIDFSATSHPAGMTSELLADYEEGTWTPTIASSAGAITTYTSSGNYVKVGKQVTVNALIKVTNVGTASGYATFGGLPYNVQTGIVDVPFMVQEYFNTGIALLGTASSASPNGAIVTLTNGNLVWTNNNWYVFTITYLVT